MKRKLIGFCALTLALGFAGVSSAATLDFELGQTGSTFGSLNALDASYGGFTWDSNYYVVTQDYYNGGYANSSTFVEGSLGAASVGTASMSLSPSSFSYLSFNFGSPVDSFTVTSSGTGNWWLMDDLSYNTASVPEPSTLILLGSGMAGLGLMRFRRRK